MSIQIPVVTTTYVTLSGEQMNQIFMDKLFDLTQSFAGQWVKHGEVYEEGDPHPHTGVGNDVLVKFRTKKEKEERIKDLEEGHAIRTTARQLSTLLLEQRKRRQREDASRKAVAP